MKSPLLALLVSSCLLASCASRSANSPSVETRLVRVDTCPPDIESVVPPEPRLREGNGILKPVVEDSETIIQGITKHLEDDFALASWGRDLAQRAGKTREFCQGLREAVKPVE